MVQTAQPPDYSATASSYKCDFQLIHPLHALLVLTNSFKKSQGSTAPSFTNLGLFLGFQHLIVLLIVHHTPITQRHQGRLLSLTFSSGNLYLPSVAFKTILVFFVMPENQLATFLLHMLVARGRSELMNRFALLCMKYSLQQRRDVIKSIHRVPVDCSWQSINFRTRIVKEVWMCPPGPRHSVFR
ncbi:hypothetical protein BJ165DRAFT_1009851 [Panaeolus papilionaceus]|nr:hypothetical protein BJ165DRAFT_1009851 [Panaeolus papilionaceus]